ncbi:(1-_4)-alpha-D-glucan 1-alpha-D-glucosylmutase [Rhizobium sp. SG_E_25_P2]|uniref:malto-oligosyltrehalose synthase n=1 Tax=Rhizobium sp. SG_E_25_P2 TaxID=2879942 RepID=UPI00247330B2|nr:malto-oligosyltrehalose synthase [Rhizobium sp. SG_E_25_P2]MDH6267776.1 (1->4)-alpha-D-glucan 1-alpha-D-glucosylmutase [Rhizobium sp. SG_E_25_P2]
MTLPTATYRLQFRNGMTFDRAIDLVPHLNRLGVSHLYCSPIFTAAAGSTHGYDIANPNEIDPHLGGSDGFDRLANALSAANIGLILDIVPNHLAASLDNGWWRSVVEWGEDSLYAGHFDIDWSQKLTLPFLSTPIEEAATTDEARLAFDPESGALAFSFYGSAYPLHPRSYANALKGIAAPGLAEILALASAARPDSEAEFHEAMRQLLAKATDLNAALHASISPERLVDIIEQQPWTPIQWQKAASGLSYRRFFEITGLVGLRVEDDQVFEDSHSLILDLVDKGVIDGLRVDHIDGLADPEAYLVKLRQRIGPNTYLVVEKILEHEEQLPSHWPVQGTTGYEVIATTALALAPDDLAPLDRAYAALTKQDYDPQTEFEKARQLMIDVNFEGEVKALERMALDLAACEEDCSTPDPDGISRGVRGLLAAFPVYRTYGSPSGLRAQDADVLLRIFEQLYRKADRDDALTLSCLQAILRGDMRSENLDDAIRFRTRMQHLTGPLLAKALEDTFFYRYHRLLALNEVGCDPFIQGGSVEHFHARMKERALRQPNGLSASSTHDTKRGEDARARLFAIAEAPGVWAEAVTRWRRMNAARVAELPDGPAPEPEVEWMIYQGLAGAWRLGEDGVSETSLNAFRDRFLAYVEKSVREAKLRGKWSDAGNAYEKAVLAYAGGLLSSDAAAFRADFETTLQPFARAGWVNSLTQTLIKLTAPGIPDIYQGSEGLDVSLVDPDNRRTVDYAALERLEASRASGWPLTANDMAAQKFRLIADMLSLRKRLPALFSEGHYVPLTIEGPASAHALAYARAHQATALLVVAPRLPLTFMEEADPRTFFAGANLVLPADLAGKTFHAMTPDASIASDGDRLALGEVFATAPYAVFLAEP